MSGDSVERSIGQLQGRLDGLEHDVGEIRSDMKVQNAQLSEILQTVNRAKGSWKTLVAIGSAGAAIIEGAHHLGEWLTHLK